MTTTQRSLTRTVFFAVFFLCVLSAAHAAEERPRARDIGLVVGTFPTGPLNAITDVEGVKVGHATVIEGDDIRTGVTAIIPGPGNLYTHPMPAWIHVGNGYGKLIGETQVREFGELETPILLTCTLCVWSAANALKEWVYEQPGMGEHTINPIVGETNDSHVNNMWADPIQREQVFEARSEARGCSDEVRRDKERHDRRRDHRAKRQRRDEGNAGEIALRDRCQHE